jgi:hypothetical protein
MKIEFQMESNGVLFKDAIDLPDDHNLTDAEIEVLKQWRFNAWLDATAPQSEEE